MNRKPMADLTDHQRIDIGFRPCAGIHPHKTQRRTDSMIPGRCLSAVRLASTTTCPCRRFVSRHWSGNSRQWAQVEEPGVSPKDERPKGAKAQKIGLEKQAWPAGPAAYRLRVAADRGGVFSASRPRRRARGLPQAPLCRPFPYLPPGKGTGGHPASIAKPRAGCRPECPDGLSRARLYPSHAWSRSEGLRRGQAGWFL